MLKRGRALLQRFSAVLIDVRQDRPCTVQEFIALVEQTNRDCWTNIRMLRQAIKELPALAGRVA